MPYVQPVLKTEIHQRNDDDRERQQPGRAPAAFAPEAQSRFPKTCEEVLSGLLVLVLSHCENLSCQRVSRVLMNPATDQIGYSSIPIYRASSRLS